jgi:hypothetical protein
MRGFEGLAANRRYAQGVQLKLQQMASDAELDRQKMDLAQQRVDNEWKVQQAQIANYKSLESERGERVNKLKDALNSVGPMVKDLADIPTDIRGFPEHEQKLAEIQAKYAETGVFDTARGQQVWRGANLDLLRNQRQNNYTAGVLTKTYANAFTSKGIDPSVGDSLEIGEDGKVQPNNYWGVNKDGSAYVAVGPGTSATGAVIPGGGGVLPQTDPLLAKPMDDQTKAGIRFRTFSATSAKQLYQIKQKRDTLTNRLTGAPADAPDAATMDQTPASPMNQGVAPSVQEVVRMTKDGRKAVFDAATKQFLRYAD